MNGIVERTSAPADLELLFRLAPPRFVIHVGAGQGTGEMHLWRRRSVPQALLVDAEASRLAWIAQAVEQNPEWRFATVVLADTDGEVDYFRASNPDEDGLLPADQLSSFWPNLHVSGQSRRTTTRLDTLLASIFSNDFEPTGDIWGIIDCLPALRILRGAGKELERWSILWLRVLLEPMPGFDESALLQATEEFLHPHGYRCVRTNESNHPALGDAIFVRDWSVALAPRMNSLAGKNRELSQQCDTLRDEIAKLSHHQTVQQTKFSEELQAQIQKFTQERNELHEQSERASQDLIAKEKLVADRQAQVLQLTRDRDEQVKLVAEQQELIGMLQSQINENSSRLHQFEAQMAERDSRQGLLKEELVKVEAQIDLIKDVLFREAEL